ncbi:MAG TPA: hypothetical protein VN193_08080 [Candidatus Angelobacter sp.]|nr:hypothetical protein [Candidatus Angelobacter sp.]
MAQVPDVDVAGFSGTAAAAVLWNGGGGSFSFTTGGTIGCVGIDLTDNQTSTACTVSASGSFTNIVCGTGIATGVAIVNETGGDSHTVNFTIVFVAGLGVEVGTVPPSAGIVQITPTNLTPPNPNAPGDGQCTPGFTVTDISAIAG